MKKHFHLLILLSAIFMSNCNITSKHKIAKKLYSKKLSNKDSIMYKELVEKYNVSYITSTEVLTKIAGDKNYWIYFADPSCKGQIEDITPIINTAKQLEKDVLLDIIVDYPLLTNDNLLILRNKLPVDGKIYCLSNVDYFSLIKLIKEKLANTSKKKVEELFTNYIFRNQQVLMIGYTYDMESKNILEAIK